MLMSAGAHVSHDVENAAIGTEKRAQKEPLGPIVTWENSTENPLNWDSSKKWTNVVLVSSQAMLSPVSSTILAVGGPAIAAEFALTNIYTPTLPVGMYVLGLGLGPLYLAPLSELRGRRIVYLGSFFLFTILTVGCALAPNITALSILRFLSGACGSAGATLGGASIGDMFRRHERGKAQALYALGPTTGPVIGPLIGAFVVNGTHGWRWLMWIMVIASAITVVLSVAFLKETYGPFILMQQSKRIQPVNLGTPTDSVTSSRNKIQALFSCAITRPFELLFRSPICAIMSIYMALIYGVLYLHLVTVPLLYGPESVGSLFSYRWQNGLTGLAYLGAGFGSFIGTVICAQHLNRSYKYMQNRYESRTGSNELQPENRMPFLQLGMTLVPMGLIIFAWSAELHVQWIVPMVGAAVFSMGMLMAYICVQTYLVDVYDVHAASALAATSLARSATSCVFAVTGFQLYENLGYAWGTMTITFICIAMLPIPILIYRYGARLRKNIRK